MRREVHRLRDETRGYAKLVAAYIAQSETAPIAGASDYIDCPPDEPEGNDVASPGLGEPKGDQMAVSLGLASLSSTVTVSQRNDDDDDDDDDRMFV